MTSGKSTPRKDRAGRSLEVAFPPVELEALKKAAEATKETLTAYVRRAVTERIEREKKR